MVLAKCAVIMIQLQLQSTARTASGTLDSSSSEGGPGIDGIDCNGHTIRPLPPLHSPLAVSVHAPTCSCPSEFRTCSQVVVVSHVLEGLSGLGGWLALAVLLVAAASLRKHIHRQTHMRKFMRLERHPGLNNTVSGKVRHHWPASRPVPERRGWQLRPIDDPRRETQARPSPSKHTCYGHANDSVMESSTPDKCPVTQGRARNDTVGACVSVSSTSARRIPHRQGPNWQHEGPECYSCRCPLPR